MTELSRRLARLEEAHRDIAETTVRVDALAAQIPEPVASVADAIRSLTPEQRESLRAHRSEAVELVAQQIADEQQRLDEISMRHRTFMEEWKRLIETGDLARLRAMSPPSDDLNEEVALLKTTLHELRVLQQELMTLAEPSTPPTRDD